MHKQKKVMKKKKGLDIILCNVDYYSNQKAYYTPSK